MAQVVRGGRGHRLLLVLPAVAYKSGDHTYLDLQTLNGLRLWLQNFPAVTAGIIVIEGAPKDGMGAIDEIDGAERLSIFELPLAYEPLRFFRLLPRIIGVLRKNISEAAYLHFAIGGLWGDWGSVAGLVAAAQRRRFAVWTDRVESKVIGFQANSKTGVRRWYYKFYSVLVKHYERLVIRCSTIGLFHGMDCYSAYASFCRKSFVVHDVHLEESDQISATELEQRLARTGPIQIVYAGRAHRDKGIFDWLEVLSIAKRRELRFQAVWFGEGPEWEAAKKRVADLGLSDCVDLPGMLHERQELICRLKRSDVFVFCHLTPESPRCLVEALICGLPIIGYDSPYPRELTQNNKSGILTPTSKPELVAEALANFLSRREVLSRAACEDGKAFTASRVFAHRSALTRLAADEET